jgi:hypothetical protein
MFDIAKIFSRDFLVGFFLPSVLFITVATFILFVFSPVPPEVLRDISGQIQGGWAVSSAIIAGWFLGILLLAINRTLFRFLEGYIGLDRTLFVNLQLRRFDMLEERISRIEQSYREEAKCGGAKPQTRQKYMQLLLHRRTYYPLKREHVLPTVFGNVLRAFETYSGAMYGMDSIPLWSRLIAVIPKDFRETINGARSQVDFAVNMIYLSLVAVLGYCILFLLTSTAPMFWIVILLLLVAWLAYQMAISAAIQWGNLFKASFDLFRGDLFSRMGIEQPGSWEKERQYWNNISQSFLYWDPIELPRTRVKKASGMQNSNDNENQ